MKEFWNERYGTDEYVYGTAPNVFFKEMLEKYNILGKALFPAEGEGRNAIYAAENGLEVVAFDYSNVARNKAMELATNRGVAIDYRVGEFQELGLEDERFDAVVLIFAHFAPNAVRELHQNLIKVLKPRGVIILEGFSENNLVLKKKNPKVGGPNNIEMLFSIAKLQDQFKNMDILQLEEVETELQEGPFHQGVGRVIRFVGRK
ncbi:class I SAM-dependent methyltransferase [Prolixibacteraceae bacterium JC049]|nr:class I SAM-dependent methyltransferase [Prolixibacteraceae bacterium JC049]